MTIIELIQQHIDEFASDRYAKDVCTPIFTVSSMVDENDHTIIITIQHNGQSLSAPLYPTKYSYNGEDDIAEVVIELYKCTM